MNKELEYLIEVQKQLEELAESVNEMIAHCLQSSYTEGNEYEEMYDDDDYPDIEEEELEDEI